MHISLLNQALDIYQVLLRILILHSQKLILVNLTFYKDGTNKKIQIDFAYIFMD